MAKIILFMKDIITVKQQKKNSLKDGQTDKIG
jgi:hypothetical protein